MEKSCKNLGPKKFRQIDVKSEKTYTNIRAIYFADEPVWKGIEWKSIMNSADRKKYSAFINFLADFFKDEEGVKTDWSISLDNALTKQASTKFKKIELMHSDFNQTVE